MWKPADSYSMTGTSCSGVRLLGNAALPRVEGRALPGRMPDRICGKKLVYRGASELSLAPNLPGEARPAKCVGGRCAIPSPFQR